MHYSEEKRDLFSVQLPYHLAHCISTDAKMGVGIAVQFKQRFNLRQLDQLAKWNQLYVGQSVHIDRVFNLITKQYYWHKPTPHTFREAILAMKNQAVRESVTHIAMPTIGAGLDRLNWDDNRAIIKEVFKDTDITILVCIDPRK